MSGPGAVLGLLALGKNHIDPVVRQDEAAGAGFRRDFGGDGAHAGRQDRGHEAGAVGPDQLLLPDRLAGDERRARDRARDLGLGIRAIAALDEGGAGGRRRPGLPLQILGLDRLAEADVDLRHENLDRLQLHDGCGRRRLVIGPARQIRGYTAGTECDGQDDNSGGVHYALLSLLSRTPESRGDHRFPSTRD